MFIELKHIEHSKRIMVNVTTIVDFQEIDGGIRMEFIGGGSLDFEDSYEYVSMLIESMK